ncbi:uncharacterized protein J3R85_000236 [Psidium guajava]|nr:uncharacterized protein J3R85_000236 [Psidium guajava]
MDPRIITKILDQALLEESHVVRIRKVGDKKLISNLSKDFETRILLRLPHEISAHVRAGTKLMELTNLHSSMRPKEAGRHEKQLTARGVIDSKQREATRCH